MTKSHARAIGALSITGLLFPAVAALAVTYDTSPLPYSDAPRDAESAVAISVLTEAEILEGNPDGTFRPNTLLNRAEFVKIAMILSGYGGITGYDCFPDVDGAAWYAPYVCNAKELRIVEGDERPGTSSDQWRFSPIRSVNYAEAVKIMVEVTNLPVISSSNELWYEGYIRASDSRGLGLGLRPDTFITRAEMARLAANFYAYQRGELDLLINAQRGSQSSRSSSSSRSSMSSKSSSSRSSSRSSSSKSFSIDPISNVDVRSQFLMLGETSPVLGAANVFMDAEPLDVREITIILEDSADSVEALLVYDDDRRFLGTATLDNLSGGGTEYVLDLGAGSLVIDRREDRGFYVRGRVSSWNAGGDSGELVQVDLFRVEGDGEWSNRAYSQDGTGDYPVFQTARSIITRIENGGSLNAPLINGTQIEIGSFRFEGEKGDGSSDLRVTNLSFQIEQTGGVTLSNVRLGADNTNQRMNCSVSGTTITCSSIDPTYGDFEDGPRELSLYADVSIPGGVNNASLRTTLNQAGSTSSAGAITWTDGTTTFTWVAFDSPVAVGTYYSL